jgi:predicted Zn-dependent protease
VDLRLARAQLLGAQGKVPVDKVLSLAQGAGRFQGEDQARLLTGLAEALFRAGEYAAGRRLVKELAGLPTQQKDSRLRLLLFDLAQRDGDELGMDEALAELVRTEGADSALAHYAQAVRQIRQSRQEGADRKAALDAARLHLDRAAALRPSWPPVTLARADVADLSGNPEQAISHLRQAIDQGESNPRVIQRLVESLYRRQRYAEADQELRRLRQALLMNSELGRLAAGIALRRGDQARALELARDAVAEDSRDFREQVWLGQMLAAVRAPTEAESKLRRAVALAPREPEPWVALVQFLAGRQQEKEARAAIAQAEQQMAPERATLALAQCWEAVGDLRAASRHYVQALEKHVSDVAVVRTVAAFHLRGGRVQEAAPLLERIVTGALKGSTGDLEWARRGLAIVLAAGTDFQRFRRALELVGLELDAQGQLVRDKSNDDDSTELQRAQARVLATQGQRQFRQRAIQLLEALARRQALTADDRFVLALLYEADGAAARAHEQLRDLVLTQVQSPFYLAQFALTLLRQRDLDQAANWITRLEKLERQQEKPVNTYGTVELRARLLEALGDGDKAIALLKAHADRAGAVPDEPLLVVARSGGKNASPRPWHCAPGCGTVARRKQWGAPASPCCVPCSSQPTSSAPRSRTSCARPSKSRRGPAGRRGPCCSCTLRTCATSAAGTATRSRSTARC